MKRSSSKAPVIDNKFNRDIDWELRPGGMLVQKRETGDASSGHMIKIKVSHGSSHHDFTISAHSTFGNHLFPSVTFYVLVSILILPFLYFFLFFN